MPARESSGPVPILFQDEHLLVVDKPARMLVVPAPGRRRPTVVDRVGDQLGSRVFAVHRLDEDTTGALVLARTAEARQALEEIFRKHLAERLYLALTVRTPSPAAGCIESRMRETSAGIMESVESGPAERAVTHYRVLARRGRHCLVECRLETGRRNQIRVHMAEIGCPIVGDRKYGDRSRGYRRPMLHAFRICFEHPLGGNDVAIEIPPAEQDLVPPPGA